MTEFLNYLLYIFFGILPSLIWLSYYLRKDVKPEPKLMVFKIFLYGMFITLPVIFFEIIIFWISKRIIVSQHLWILFYIFFGVALVEEVFKYLVIKWEVLNDPEFNEPVDAMIYMIIAALGFAAVENILVFFRLKPWWEIFEISILRFLGATFLHALCSGIIGFFLGLSFFDLKKRGKLVLVGLLLAVLLHGFYNFSIIKIEEPLKILIPVLILIGSAIFVSFGFRKLKNMMPICE